MERVGLGGNLPRLGKWLDGRMGRRLGGRLGRRLRKRLRERSWREDRCRKLRGPIKGVVDGAAKGYHVA